ADDLAIGVADALGGIAQLGVLPEHRCLAPLVVGVLPLHERPGVSRKRAQSSSKDWSWAPTVMASLPRAQRAPRLPSTVSWSKRVSSGYRRPRAAAFPTSDHASVSLCVTFRPAPSMPKLSARLVEAGSSVAMMPPSAGTATCELLVAAFALVS